MANVPISTIVSVEISRQTQSVTQAGFGTPLILGDEDTGWGSERIRTYTSTDEVLEDFASSTDTYKAAAAIFSQEPTVEEIKVGAEGTRVAQIVTVVFSANIVTGNSIALTIDDNDLTVPFNTSNAQTLTDLAAAIQALDSISTAVSNGTNTITITAAIAGVSISVGTAVVTGGASQATAVTTTTTANHGPADDLAEIAEIDADWYGVIWIERGEELVLEMAEYIETVRKIFITCTDDTDVLNAGVTTDIASVLSAANYSRTSVIWNEDPLDFADAAWMGRLFTYDPGSETWKFKTLSGITSDALTSSERSAASGKNCNIYIEIGGVDITSEGVMASGEYIDIMRGVDWLQARMEERIYSRLINLTKVPYTDAGIAVIEAEIRAVLENGIRVGLIADDPAYTVTVPRASEVSENDRAERLLPDVEFTARLAGAIHRVTVQGTVTV